MSGARTVHLLRHGATVRPGLLLGHLDVAVTPQGIADCVRVVAGAAFTQIVSSDLSRAADCAAALGAPVRHDPRWRELDFGTWDGCDPATLPTDALAAFWRDPDSNPPPQGERWSGLVTRVTAALADLPDGTLVVTHGGAIRAALASACGFDARQVWAFDLPCAALLTLRLWPDTAQVAGLRT
ncbi:histidine phosphatase family protein [Sphingomonas endophytica]|uniref:Alpha-ribazole phosphatase n=1 Tax=Sphingomonas endophytica TaxID=869719 RepID=A0A7X0JC16_9SPHN|nr:histidine phosphatase family protein [Sphingomonas endophytica]MBB5726795.1 alpha-ribazole phosphatase [Sphingomonas endophytica]MBB6504444.1 alpha-ribazole phosphatase [Sphingomonas endophytica]